MKETDDGKSLDGLDPGAVPGHSTKSLCGSDVHGVKTKGYFYTQSEWSRMGLPGQVPPERIWGGNRHRQTDESLQEDSDT